MVTAALDWRAATDRGIRMCGTDSYRSRGTPELTWGPIIALTRHSAVEDQAIRQGRWQTAIGPELQGLTLGLLGLGIDEEYGGGGGTARQIAVAVEEIARACAATSTIYIAHLSLCAQFIQMFGTEGQKRQFLPTLVRGEKIGAFALTEPEAGSDPASMTTTATRTNGSYRLNGTKTFIPKAGSPTKTSSSPRPLISTKCS